MFRVGNKGYIRTLEAVLAIVLLLLFVYTVTPRSQETTLTQEEINIELIQNVVFLEFSNNKTLRNDIINDNDVRLKYFVNKVKSNRFESDVTIQDINTAFVVPPTIPSDKSIFTKSIVIATDLTDYGPKVVTLYLWLK